MEWERGVLSRDLEELRSARVLEKRIRRWSDKREEGTSVRVEGWEDSLLSLLCAAC